MEACYSELILSDRIYVKLTKASRSKRNQKACCKFHTKEFFNSGYLSRLDQVTHLSTAVAWRERKSKHLILLSGTVNSRFKKDLKLQIYLHKSFFFGFLDSLHKSFLNQTTLDLRKEKWTFLNQEFTVYYLNPEFQKKSIKGLERKLDFKHFHYKARVQPVLKQNHYYSYQKQVLDVKMIVSNLFPMTTLRQKVPTFITNMELYGQEW